jgi:hypothetical protein
MKKRLTFLTCVTFFLSAVSQIIPQTTQFDLNNYKTFLNTNQNMSSSGLMSLYDSGEFKKKVDSFDENALYLDSMSIKYELTENEKTLLKQNGFLVTERVRQSDFINMFLDIYAKDLPVFISTDAILNALHKSYDLMLKGVEIRYLIPKLEELLEAMYNKFPQLGEKYSANTDLQQMLYDTDVYLTVARKLLNDSSLPFYSDNNERISEILQHVGDLNTVSEPFFSEVLRDYDYSQFKVRGHYTDENFPQLAGYFKAMIWLGRTEIYLIAPETSSLPPTKEDIQRQIIDSKMISELFSLAEVQPVYNEFEKVISSFVGEQDNVTITQLNSVFESAGIIEAAQLLDTNKVYEFQDSLITKPFAAQKILSQLLESDPYNAEQIKPASAFMLFGQRFVMDSYVTANVVFDKIIYNNQKITRILPSMLDMLFALGNSSAAQLLVSELDNYHYSSNLAALKYLIDSYGDDFWQSSIYNSWLSSLRALNPPADRSNLPEFMQTAAWWQEKINTQAASWAELRHDNILYAKQSYTGIPLCSYPYGFVEPSPEFFDALKTLSEKTIEKFQNLSLSLENETEHFQYFANCMDTLEAIAIKELNNSELDDSQNRFLKKVVYQDAFGCGDRLDGWYYHLIYKDGSLGDNTDTDYIVADYHTSASDEQGNLVGWVKHAGTGMRDLCVVTFNIPGVGDVAFAGPVSSYYEYTTTNFLRLSDEDWVGSYLALASCPDWVNIYLADEEGNKKIEGSKLMTGVNQQDAEPAQIPSSEIIVKNYPNPFNPETIISFTIPSGMQSDYAELNIYNIQGELVKKLFAGKIQPGTYLSKWNGKNSFEQSVSSGIYLYEVTYGGKRNAGKMNLIK